MKRGTYLRIVLVSLASALVLCAFSLLCLGWLFEIADSRHRGDFFLFLAESVERHIVGLSADEIRDHKSLLREAVLPPMGPPPGMPSGSGPGGPPFPPPPGGEPHGPGHHHGGFLAFPGGPPPGPPPGMDIGRRPPGPPRADLWLLTSTGDVLASTSTRPFPAADWAMLPKSQVVHEIASKQGLFGLYPAYYVIRLTGEPGYYLVIRDEKNPFRGPLFMTQAVLTFVTVGLALLLSMTLTFFYLRRKSAEARAVLLRLERGDLRARFPIKRFDEFGGLLLDFNRMADEIERLVSRVHQTERERRQLVQEVGHDLRTPLTSLTTSFETLKFHFDKMSSDERGELLEMIGAEIGYFRELLDKLMTIASLDQPHFKESTETIDLAQMLRQENKQRQSGGTSLQWSIAETGDANLVLGDAHLLMRVFKNAYDNAARFARGQVSTEIAREGDMVRVTISDDGPGLTPEVLEAFGVRRGQRVRREGAKLDFSLGLGSVIMKAIVELHGGRLKMENRQAAAGISGGARLTILIPIA